MLYHCSCFLLTMKDDSIEGIYDTLKQCALISKSAGGIGVNVHCIRASGTYISGTNGISNGLVPMLRVYNNTGEQSLIYWFQHALSQYWWEGLFLVFTSQLFS